MARLIYLTLWWFSTPKQCTIFKISDVDPDRESVKCDNIKFRPFIESMIKKVYLSSEIWNITRVSAMVKVQYPKTMSNLSNLLCPIRPRKPSFASTLEPSNALEGTRGRSCRLRSNAREILDHYGTSRYNCAMVNQNFVGIGPNSAISVRLCPLLHAKSPEHVLEWVTGDELETIKLKGCPMFMITVSWPLYEHVWCFLCLKTSIIALFLIQWIIKILHFHILRLWI